MTATRTVGPITITVDGNTVRFCHADGRTAHTSCRTHGLSEADVAFSYDEEDALRYIQDQNATEVQAYVDHLSMEGREDEPKDL